MQVLVVDDNPAMLDALGALVRRAFSEVQLRTAWNLTEALNAARSMAKLDLVLLDLGLPGCFGSDALLQFRREFPTLRVLVVSALQDQHCANAALEAGAAGYLPMSAPLRAAVAALRRVGRA